MLLFVCLGVCSLYMYIHSLVPSPYFYSDFCLGEVGMETGTGYEANVHTSVAADLDHVAILSSNYDHRMVRK